MDTSDENSKPGRKPVLDDAKRREICAILAIGPARRGERASEKFSLPSSRCGERGPKNFSLPSPRRGERGGGEGP